MIKSDDGAAYSSSSVSSSSVSSFAQDSTESISSTLSSSQSVVPDGADSVYHRDFVINFYLPLSSYLCAAILSILSIVVHMLIFVIIYRICQPKNLKP